MFSLKIQNSFRVFRKREINFSQVEFSIYDILKWKPGSCLDRPFSSEKLVKN